MGDDEKTDARHWPEEPHASGVCIGDTLFRWTYTYMNPLLKKGALQHREGNRLVQDDLYVLPKSMQSEHVTAQFRSIKAAKKKVSLGRSLWQIAAPTYIRAGFCQLLTVVCQSSMPVLVWRLLQVLEDNPSEQVVREGLPFAVGVFAALFANALFYQRQRHLAMQTGVLIRNVVINLIYEHVMHLSPQGRVGLTTGEVTTLVAVDAQKLFEVTQEGHLSWSLPLSITVVTTLLMITLGPVTLVGISVLVMFVPIAYKVQLIMFATRGKRAKLTDERVGLSSTLLQGIKVVKLNNNEHNYLKRITEVRAAEAALLKKELLIWAFTLTLTVISPVVATSSTFAVYVLVSPDNQLTAARTFATLLLFSVLRFPINYAALFLGKAAQAASGLKRIEEFLNRALLDDNGSSSMNLEQEGKGASDLPQLEVKNASFEINAPGEETTDGSLTADRCFKASGFTFSAEQGEVVAVCGPVGSGKSTLINGIIGEVAVVGEDSNVVVRGRVAYAPQTPFILNTTIRENILFGLPFDKELYDRVIDACCLQADIDQIGVAGDMTEIGERGVTLSGGQKQRVSLARAAYAQPDLVLLDDPLSALDAETAKVVFDRLIRGDGCFFSNTAVVLVTHAAHFLNLVDNIVVVVGGESKFYGTWSDLACFDAEDEETRKAVDHMRESLQEEMEDPNKDQDDDGKQSDMVSSKAKHKIMTVEKREYGLSSTKVWLLWFKYAGGCYFISLQALFLALDRFTYVAVEFWISRWTDGVDESVEMFGIEFEPQSNGRSAQHGYLKVLVCLVVLSVSFTALRSEWAVTGGVRAAKKAFVEMLGRVIYAPQNFFETTPMGRVLNRFTYDIEVIDSVLTEAMSVLMIASSWFIAGVTVMTTILPWMLLVIVPVVVKYWTILRSYRVAGVDLQRLDAVSRSPLQAMVAEVLEGSSSIRVFEREKKFVQRFRAAADANGAALLNFITAQRWLGVRIESMGACVVLAATTLVVALNGSLQLPAGVVGLLVIWAANFTVTLGFIVDSFGQAEAAITAIERVDAMTRIPIEKAMETEPKYLPPTEWPASGELQFDRVCMRYREGLPLALNNLSFTVPSGKRCGVVGRTGAGKSSLTVALFRVVEIEAGRILLDGHDLGRLGLADVRGRRKGMAIIPQDPFLMGSTLRDCVDPFRESGDAEVLDALRSVRMAQDEDTSEKLDTIVEEGGSNYSVGERQLLNLARALLSQPKVLVLDEATASVDGETDAFIQKMLRTRFQETTLLTIAHRLNTIMDYDVVLVMAEGGAAEFGSPADLLEKNGKFAQLIDSTGAAGSKALRESVRMRASYKI